MFTQRAFEVPQKEWAAISREREAVCCRGRWDRNRSHADCPQGGDWPDGTVRAWKSDDLSYYCYNSYQCLSVPGMSLLSYPLLSQPCQANDASVSWEHDPPILIDCRWMHPWARYDIPTSVILLLPYISMLVSPRHDSPLKSYTIAANDASVSWSHDHIPITSRWMHPLARHDIPPSVIFLLSYISMLVSPRHDSPIAANDASVRWEHDPPISIDCRWMHPWARYHIPTSVISLL